MSYGAPDHWPESRVSFEGRRVFQRDDVRERIEQLIHESTKDLILTQETALQYFLTIAFADPGELINVEIGCCRRCYGQDHKYQWKQYEYEEALAHATKTGEPLPDWQGGYGFDATREPLPDCPACHGKGISQVVLQDTRHLSPAAKLLFNGVKQTRNGVEYLMADRQKAFENACRIAGLFQDLKGPGWVGTPAAPTDPEQLQTMPTDKLARMYQDMMSGKLRLTDASK
jgi:hypothetical protein